MKNLSFATTEAGLRTCFENSGLRVRSVSIPRKKGKGSSDAVLSMGFGFVEFVDAESVEKAIKVSLCETLFQLFLFPWCYQGYQGYVLYLDPVLTCDLKNCIFCIGRIKQKTKTLAGLYI